MEVSTSVWDSDHGDYEPFHRLRLARAFADYLTDPIDGIRVTGILANGGDVGSRTAGQSS